MRFVNLTPHPINVYTEHGIKTIEPEPTPARCLELEKPITNLELDGEEILVTEKTYGSACDLPEPSPDKVYIVSALVLEACPGRDDLLVPDHLVRDQQGFIIGCQNFYSHISH